MHIGMDWRSIRFDWNKARAFLVTAEEGSFSAAGRALGLAQPTVGRQVAGLEEELGVALFERVGGGLTLTESGLELLEHARTMGEAATRVSLSAAGHADAVDGLVTITASQLISAYLLPGAIARLRREHPGVQVEVVADDAVRDLQRREADIAVRNVQPSAPDLMAKKLRQAEARAYAAPSYLERLGDPSTPEGLARAEFFSFSDPVVVIEYLSHMGLHLTPDQFPVRIQDHLAQWAMCRQGLGICFVMEEVGDADPAVQRVLPDLPPLPVPLWLVSHRELRTSRRMRLVFDILADELSRVG